MMKTLVITYLGFGEVDDCLVPPCQYNLSVHLEADIARSIFRVFGYSRNVSIMSGYGPLGNDNQIPLRFVCSFVNVYKPRAM